jgi:GDPmannose 4,6-dehydratase
VTGRKRALITGITGQDGSYLAELLLTKGYEVHGLVRRASTFNRIRIDHLYGDPGHRDQKLVATIRRLASRSLMESDFDASTSDVGFPLRLHYGDLNDSSSLNRVLQRVRPDEVYNLGAQSHVQVSFEVPEYTAEVTAVGAVRLLDAIRDFNPEARFYQASSSEMFGKARQTPQNEETPFHPRSPYGVAKLFAHWATVNYREAYGLFACSGILFNHESPRRGETFVTRKTTRAVGRIRRGLQEKLFLGNLDARRDWGWAPDYVEAMWMMLQQDTSDDYVIGSERIHTVRELCERAFQCIGMSLEWTGEGREEKGIERKTGQVRVEIDPAYYRPAEVDCLQADASKAHDSLGWRPKVSFDQMVERMVEADVRLAEQEGER